MPTSVSPTQSIPSRPSPASIQSHTVALSFPSITSCPLGLAGSPGNNQHSRKPQGLRLWGLASHALPSAAASPADSIGLAQREGKGEQSQEDRAVVTHRSPNSNQEAPTTAPGCPEVQGAQDSSDPTASAPQVGIEAGSSR
jgi:hypothetical protein